MADDLIGTICWDHNGRLGLVLDVLVYPKCNDKRYGGLVLDQTSPARTWSTIRATKAFDSLDAYIAYLRRIEAEYA